jgi:tRNA A-37 threonylcarbamoyl transferase component Bud32/DNA-binding response OmpR family regulator
MPTSRHRSQSFEVSVPLQAPAPPPLPLRMLVVHDDVGIRLRLADLLTPHCPGAAIDTCGLRAAVDLGPKLREYAVALVVVSFGSARAGLPGDPVAIVRELRALSRALLVVVIGSGGDERSAVRALRAGALDYWPLHTVDPGELVALLREQTRAGSTPSARVPSAPVLPGYRIVKELVRSARARLYLADSEELGHPVALKVHRHDDLVEAPGEERERFLRECRLLSGLNHRSIADVYDFGVTDDCHWLAMEYFPCGSLKARLQHPLTEPEAVAYAAQVGQALGVVHAAGLVHRDLKPSNVMLRADDRIALIDFGLARPALGNSSVTSPNIRVGSPYYMAPEQIEGLPPDGRCDLYALGVLFYELLTGQLPYAGSSVAEVLEQHRKARPPRLPDPLARYQPLLDHLLAKRPPERVPTAQAFLEALAAAGPPSSERSPNR